MFKGEELLRPRQLRLVLETHHVGRLEVALGMLVWIAARADFVVELGRLKGANLKLVKSEKYLSELPEQPVGAA